MDTSSSGLRLGRDVDPLEELIRVVNEAQERDAEDERRCPITKGLE